MFLPPCCSGRDDCVKTGYPEKGPACFALRINKQRQSRRFDRFYSTRMILKTLVVSLGEARK
jgi:hypothetical protein